MQDGTLGYTYRFPATVAGGTLHGENGQPHISGWLTLDGAIRPDGAALLAAEGLSGSPDYAAGRVARLSASLQRPRPVRRDAGHRPEDRDPGLRVQLRQVMRRRESGR